MGIYDREYVRREKYGFLGSFAERGRVCKWLIGITIGVFLAQVLTPREDNWIGTALALDGGLVLKGQIWRLLTYAFLHPPDDIWPLVFNMLFLWWFGSDMEDLYGPREFLSFYLGAALAGGLLFVAVTWAWHVRNAVCFGAYAPILAVLVLCTIHYPRRTLLLFFILPVPLWLFLVIVLAGDALLFVSRGAGAASHFGGALFAGVYYRMHWRMTDWLPQLSEWRRQLFRPRLRVYREEPARTPVGVSASPLSEEDEQLEAKMDAILEKISRVGKENLTDHERQVLLRASEAIRRRRS